MTSEIVFRNEDVGKDGVGYYHVENGTTTSWSGIAQTISRYDNANRPLVPLEQWVSRVQEFSKDGESDDVPASVLIEFLGGIRSGEQSSKMDLSNTMRFAPEVDFGVISEKLVNSYMDYQCKK